jgi:hypothetical protein
MRDCQDPADRQGTDNSGTVTGQATSGEPAAPPEPWKVGAHWPSSKVCPAFLSSASFVYCLPQQCLLLYCPSFVLPHLEGVVHGVLGQGSAFEL